MKCKIIIYISLSLTTISLCMKIDMPNSSKKSRASINVALLKEASKNNNLELFKKLLEKTSAQELELTWLDIFFTTRGKENENLFERALYIRSMEIDPLLHKSVRAGLLNNVYELLRPENLNSKNVAGETPLLLSVMYYEKTKDVKYYEIFKLLLERNANPCTASKLGVTPLSQTGTPQLAVMLLQHGAFQCIDKQNDLGNTPLSLSVFSKNYDVASLLMDKKSNVNNKDIFGKTPLHLAIEYPSENIKKSIELIQKLLIKGADINSQSNDGNTPLHNAIDLQNRTLIGLLIKEKANVDLKNNDGITTRHLLQKIWHLTPEEFTEIYPKPNFAEIIKLKSKEKEEKQAREEQGRKQSFLPSELKSIPNTKYKTKTTKKPNKNKLPTYNQKKEKERQAATHDQESTPIEEKSKPEEISEKAGEHCKIKENSKSRETSFILAQRILDWRNSTWLAAKDQVARDNGEYYEFLRSKVYHRLPDSLIIQVLKHGELSEKPNKTFKDITDTTFNMRGEIQFRGLNPWKADTIRQQGYFHVVKGGKDSKIYHLGFDAVTQKPEVNIPVEWISQETPSYIAIYEPSENVRYVLYLKSPSNVN